MKVLIIDDDIAITMLCALQFQRRGHVVRQLQEARHATRVFLEFAPEIVILDYDLGRMTGLEVFEAMRAQTPLTAFPPVIFITSHAHSIVHLQLREAGAAAVVFKPFSVRELITLAASLVAPTPRS